MKVRIIVRVALYLLEILAKQTETEIDDIAVQKIRSMLRNRKRKVVMSKEL